MSKTFTDTGRAKRLYDKAYEMNKGQNEIYYCATSSYITPRKLDLHSEFPFVKQQPDRKKNNNIKEYRLQAYMVKEALKKTDWLLPINGKKWRLLDAERNFAREDLNTAKGHRRLDLLAYEDETQSYIVLELKIPGKSSGELLATANNELTTYTGAINKFIGEANTFYSIEADLVLIQAHRVKGYIVCSSMEKQLQEYSWGSIEYNAKDLDDIENIKLNIIKEPD